MGRGECELGAATAVTVLVIGIFGAGLGPTVVGVLSDQFAARAYAGPAFIASCPGGRGASGIGWPLDIAASAEGLGSR